MWFCYCLETFNVTMKQRCDFMLWAQIALAAKKFALNVFSHTQHFAGQQNWLKVDENQTWSWKFNLPSQAKSTTNSSIDWLQWTISQNVGLKSYSAFLLTILTHSDNSATPLQALSKFAANSIQHIFQHAAIIEASDFLKPSKSSQFEWISHV